jgi:RNA methyltransferase, TrmH family
VITSISNPGIKRIRALRQRKHRDATGLLFVDGLRAFREGIDLERDVDTLIVAPGLLANDAKRLARESRRLRLPVVEVSERVFATLSARDNPDGVGAIVRQRWQALDQTPIEPESCWIALHSVRDPRNVGAILRIADAVGAAGVVLLDDSVDPYSPEAVRASTGAVFAQRLVRAPFADFDAWRRRHGAACVGTSAEADRDYAEVEYPRPLVLLMGSERGGLPAEHQSACDYTVHIPMAGRVSSLNLAVATGVILYEVFNQRRRPRRA